MMWTVNIIAWSDDDDDSFHKENIVLVEVLRKDLGKNDVKAKRPQKGLSRAPCGISIGESRHYFITLGRTDTTLSRFRYYIRGVKVNRLSFKPEYIITTTLWAI